MTTCQQTTFTDWKGFWRKSRHCCNTVQQCLLGIFQESLGSDAEVMAGEQPRIEDHEGLSPDDPCLGIGHQLVLDLLPCCVSGQTILDRNVIEFDGIGQGCN